MSKKILIAAAMLFLVFGTFLTQPAKADTQEHDIITGKWSADELYYKATLSNVSITDNSEYLAAVWSDRNGQDDLKWMLMNRTDANTFAVNIRIGDFKSPGTFHLHIYRRSAGNMYFIGARDFEVQVFSGGISMVNVADDKVSATAHISGDWTADDNCSFKLAIWSTANQSNLVWYDVDAGSGDGSLSFDISNHAYELGTYHLHLYIINKQGIMYILNGVDATLSGTSDVNNAINGTWSSDKMYYKAILSGTPYVANSDYLAAVWSDRNGQDDLKWMSMNRTGVNTFAVDIRIGDFKSPGTFHLHIYRRTAGNMYFIGARDFEVQVFSGGISSVNVADDKVSATAHISGDWNVDDNCSLKLAVWSTANQSNLVWYDVDAGSGDGSLSFDISNHAYELGTYHLHLYIINRQGIMYILNGVDVKIQGNSGESNVINGICSADRSSYKIILSKAEYVPNSQYYAATWSDENGQDDIKWLSMERPNDNTFTAEIRSREFSSSGLYHIHLYRVTNGTHYILGAAQVELERNYVNALEQIVELGKSRAGYLEKSRSAYLANPAIVYELTAGAGEDNYAECWEDTKPIQIAGIGQGGSWCVNFVYWLFYKNFGAEQTAAALYLNDWRSSIPWQNFSCKGWVDNFTQHGKKYSAYDCQPGDVIFFTISHMGLVYDVDSDYIYTIEGNTSSKDTVISNGGCVRLKRYAKSYSGIQCVCRPDYSVLG